MSKKNRDDRIIKDYHLRDEIFNNVKMDCRCPRELKTLPVTPCTFALNKIYNTGREDQRCEWYIIHADSNYCFFAYHYFRQEKKHILDEIASLNNISITAVDVTIKNGLITLAKEYGLESYDELIDLLNIDVSAGGD